VSSIDTGFETGEAGRLSNRQSHSPPSPNPFRTDFMPRNFLVLLNTFACVMRWPSPSSPAARALASLKFRHAQGTQCERISQKFNHEVFGATMEHGLPLSTGFESFHRWIATLPKRGIDPLHYDVVDFAALMAYRFLPALRASTDG
jgi:hypothetical protein